MENGLIIYAKCLDSIEVLDSPCTRTVNARVARRKQDAFNCLSFPNLASMEAALAELNSSESPCIAAVARKYGIKRTTLSRRWKGVTINGAQASEEKSFFNYKEEQQRISDSSVVDAFHRDQPL